MSSEWKADTLTQDQIKDKAVSRGNEIQRPLFLAALPQPPKLSSTMILQFLTLSQSWQHSLSQLS